MPMGLKAGRETQFINSVLRPIAGLVLKSDRLERWQELPIIMASLVKRHKSNPTPLVIGMGFEYQKRRLLRRLFPQNVFLFLPMYASGDVISTILAGAGEFTPWVWSYRDQVRRLPNNIWGGRSPVRVEDGFIRSVGIGMKGGPPYSFCFDRQGMYFNATGPSDLEFLLEATDLSQKQDTIAEARQLIDEIRKTGVTKYNFPQVHSPKPARSEARNVLVIGQVEDDESIKRNRVLNAASTNAELLACALREAGGKRVVFRPHPDVVSGRRPQSSDLSPFAGAFEVEQPGKPLKASLLAADCVYTISSLAGFEALLHNVRVKTYGGPFYAGWGLTEDRAHFPRRTRRLRLDEIFAIAYILYPKYFNPATGSPMSASQVLSIMAAATASPGTNSPSP